MFFLKKLVSQFLYPLQFSTLILVLGILLVLLSRRQKLGKGIMVIGLLSLLGFSYSPVPNRLQYALERTYAPAFTSTHPALSVDPTSLRWIVVLAGGHSVAPHLPATSQLSPTSLARVVEGIRLHRHLPHSKLVLSGGVVTKGISHGEMTAAAAQELGVEAKHIVVAPSARDTHEEALAMRTIVGTDPFMLVTSASHMPRSAALFRKAGLAPIPSPGDYRVPSLGNQELKASHFFPQAKHLLKSTIAVHEYIGMLWAKFRQQI